MTIFVFMKKMNIKNKYVFSLVIISIMVAFLIHFPELVSLFDVTGQNALFPDMSVLDVANESFSPRVPLTVICDEHVCLWFQSAESAYLLAEGSALVRNDLVRE